jgi:hypothetical protein
MFLLVLGSSCQLARPEDPIIIPLVDTEFQLDLWEDLSPDGRQLVVHISTITDEPCLNTTVSTEQRQVDRRIELTIKDILEPETCDPGLSPARGKEVLAGASAGVYDLTIELQDVVTNAGNLTVASSYYAVVMESENGVTWLHKELRRVPLDAVWGYIHYESADQAAHADALLDQLQGQSQALPRTDGYYGYFILDNGGTQLTVTGMPATGIVRPFLYRLSGEPAELTALIEDWRSQAPAGMSIAVFDSYGRSW